MLRCHGMMGSTNAYPIGKTAVRLSGIGFPCGKALFERGMGSGEKMGREADGRHRPGDGRRYQEGCPRAFIRGVFFRETDLWLKWEG